MVEKEDKIIEDLKRRRDNLQIRIKDWYDDGKDARKLVIEYLTITKSLQDKGCRVSSRAPYLKLEFWDTLPEPKKKAESKPVSKVEPETKVEEKSIEPIAKNYYIINLAWTQTSEEDLTDTINKLKDYFTSIGAREVESLENDVGHIERIIKYEFEGNDSSFKILKDSATFLLDTISTTDYERFNIAIYGKKRNY